MKKNIVLGLACVLAVAACVWGYYQHRNNVKNELRVVIYEAENRVLKDYCRELEWKVTESNGKPTYEDGQRDAIIRMGGPSNPGAYRDGYEAAVKALGKNDYAEGYHAAINQFGYKTDLYLVAKPGTTDRSVEPQPHITGGMPPEKKNDKK